MPRKSTTRTLLRYGRSMNACVGISWRDISPPSLLSTARSSTGLYTVSMLACCPRRIRSVPRRLSGARSGAPFTAESSMNLYRCYCIPSTLVEGMVQTTRNCLDANQSLVFLLSKCKFHFCFAGKRSTSCYPRIGRWQERQEKLSRGSRQKCLLQLRETGKYCNYYPN